ncbi:brain-specific angiogenesis inhibitor 1-associated protein 2-like protein 1 isoform X1 [Acipenser oxyrinchus oxyrinchus]|uniref:BAR/IMD domain-containing adapter protein 2-like 1 n=1 Tax=Acipenser oxyrinchus oxyrinchus TaxID=40147 RepID=A0AAD8G4J6_ACIOX|nr:brain-specific angiogenesis inhibitor 1-associated protein 2-like protein 1 isoform X1 [Acipenser oxyrinchus oxyrinchus]
MSRDPEEVNKLTESTYKNVMEQFNPGLRNLVTLGKNYEKAVVAMTLAGKMYYDAVSKIGEIATVSPVSRELGVVLMEISDVQKKLNVELEENFKKFHKDIIAELERKTELDQKYMNATLKRYQTEHRSKLDSLERSQTDLKKLRRKSQGKNVTKYETKENEYLETVSSRQTDMQKFIADGCREALLEEKRRFCFLVDKHCTFSYHLCSYHDKAKELLNVNLPSWQDKCTDATKVPDTVMTMIKDIKTPGSTPVSGTPQPSPMVERYVMHNTEPPKPPPAPQIKAHPSPLVEMFNIPATPKAPAMTQRNSLHSDYNNGDYLPKSVSVATGLNTIKRPKMKTIFPHTAGNNSTLLSFDEGDIIILLLPEEKDGWLYGEHEQLKQKGWFPSSYCRPYTEEEQEQSSSMPVRSISIASLAEKEKGNMVLPAPDYFESSPTRTVNKSTFPEHTSQKPNGIVKSLFEGGENPFATVKLRPTVTNDRSAPII